MINLVREVDNLVGVDHALISVSDKRMLETLVPGLLAANPKIRIYSTGGTYERIAELLGPSRDALVSVSDYTGQPEMQGGLVKTLDFKIYLGLLSETYNDAHRADIARVGGVTFDLVVANLYPFENTVAAPDATPEAARGNVDIGGPSMLRAAAKNFLRVAAVCDPRDYAGLLGELELHGGRTTLAFRFACARKAFEHTAAYDRAISAYLAKLDPADIAANYRMMDE